MIINFDPEFETSSEILDNVISVDTKEDVKEEYFSQARGIIVRLGTVLNRSFLSKFISLRFVATITTGTDHIDEAFCAENSIKLISLKGQTEFLKTIRATPEHTWGLLLALVRRIPWAHRKVCEGVFDRKSFFGYELFGKTIGIIGFGRVGKIIAGYARSFGMSVSAHDINESYHDGCPDKFLSLDELLRSSDIVSVNLSLDDTTKRYLRSEHFEIMKKQAVLINTSRGEIIDESDLLLALKEKRIAGAAIDVLTDENSDNGISACHPLIEYAKYNQNLLITPHISGSTVESMEKTAHFIALKIKEFEAA